MKVFITGATGFIGTALVQELLDSGHQVLGLARSDASAQALVTAGAEVQRGDLQDLESLKHGAAAADGVIHAGFVHDFSRFKEVCEIDRLAIEAIGNALVGSNKPFIVTSGTALVRPGQLATEDMASEHDPAKFPRVSEAAGLAFADRNVRAMVMRLSPSVHGEGDMHGFIPILINIARTKGVAAYTGDGLNRWNAVHRLDAVRLFRLALEHGETGARYHAVGEEAIPFKTITEGIGAKLNIPIISVSPAEATAYFAWFTHFAAIDCPASSKISQERLGWRPSRATLIDDLAGNVYVK